MVSKWPILKAGSRTKAISVLNPIGTIRCLGSCSITQDIVEGHVCSVHDVQAPQRRLLDEEIGDCDVAHVPKDERHRSPRLGMSRFRSIPDIAVTIDPPGSIAIDGDVIPGNNEASVMVLEGDGIGIVTPIRKVCGKL